MAIGAIALHGPVCAGMAGGGVAVGRLFDCEGVVIVGAGRVLSRQVAKCRA
jgi:hypothetical protein